VARVVRTSGDMRKALLFTLCLGAICATSSVGCAQETASEESETDEAEAIARSIENELSLLGGSRDDVERLRTSIQQRVDALEGKKEAAKERAKRDVEGYSDGQWQRSWFSRDEMDEAIKARSRDIFDRPERRALDGAKAQLAIIDAVLGGKDATEMQEPYLELALSVPMNGDLGLLEQVPPRILHVLRKKIFRFLRERRGGEAANIGRDGNPMASNAWSARGADDVTPAKLYAGPWYAQDELPKLPAAGETWDLVELRSQKSDGAHASIEIGHGDAKLTLKLHTDPETGLWTEPAYARLLWAMGYETDPQYKLEDVRVTPRVYVAAHASIARVGLKIGSSEDEVIPGRPPRGLSIALNGISKAPGAGWVTVRYRDGHEDSGEAALDRLRTAMDDRGAMDAMESVLIKRAYGELERPGKWSSIGPWDYDTDNHIDDREVRAIAIVMMAWLGSDDLKFNNLRLDAHDNDAGRVALVLADVGKEKKTTELAWDVGIRADGRFVHPDTNAYTVKAFDRLTTDDAKWAARRVGALSEDQIVACLAAGAFDDAALGVYAEKIIARRDEIVRTFGLQGELGLLRPNGPNANPPPRKISP
jgi:hypothetical protein